MSLLRYAAAVGVAALAVTLAAALAAPFGGVRFFIPIGLLAILALYAGAGPGLACTLLTAAGLVILVEGPARRFELPGEPVVPQLIAFVLVGLLASAIAGAQRRSRAALAREIAERKQAEAAQQRLAAIVESTDDAVLAKDLRGTILSWNPAAERLLGWTAAEATGRSVSIVVPPERRQEEKGILARIAAGERMEHYETERLTRGGDRKIVSISVSPLRDSAGTIVGASTILRDITERKLAEQAVRESQERFRAVFRQAAVGIGRVDMDGRFLEVNERYAAILGYTPAELRGKTFQEITFPDDLSKDLEQARRLAAGEIPTYSMEKRYVRRDGSLVWVNLTVSMSEESPSSRYFIVVIEDIAERKRAEHAFRDAMAEVASSKRRLEVILANLPVGVFIADADGHLVEANDGARAIWGGAPMAAGIPEYAQYRGFWPDTGTPIAAEDWALARAVARGETVVGQIADIERFDGTRGTILNNAAPIRDDDGRIIGAVDVNLDITEHRRAEQALRESEARLRRLYESGMIGVIYFDLEGAISDANDKFLDMVGYTRADLQAGQLRWQSMTPPEHRSADALAVAELRATGVDTPYEKEFIRKDGSRIAILIGAALFDDARHRGIAFVLDLTSRKRSEAAVQHANERLREADRRKNEFLAMLSHELRNPLAPITNSLYVLERATPGGQQAKRAHEVIGRQVAHMKRLIEDLLDVTRISRGKVRLQRERVELCDLVRRTAEDHRALFDASGIELETRTCAAPLYTDGDPTRLGQVIGNLLSNAVKFTPRGGRVSLSLSSDPGQASIHVRDNGAGIATPLLGRLFQPFVQSEVTLDRSKGGLGLGLALVKGLVELHGGSVEVSSDGPGTGAEFTVNLPLDASATQAAAETAGAAEGDGATTRRRILVIEDNVDAAESLKEALELDGHVVELAADGQEGIERARSFRPDVVLCDLGLPGIDGFEVARRMRADVTLQTIPLVALSGYAAPEDLERSREAGFDQHLAKPPDLRVLEQMLSEVTASSATSSPAPW